MLYSYTYMATVDIKGLRFCKLLLSRPFQTAAPHWSVVFLVYVTTGISADLLDLFPSQFYSKLAKSIRSWKDGKCNTGVHAFL